MRNKVNIGHTVRSKRSITSLWLIYCLFIHNLLKKKKTTQKNKFLFLIYNQSLTNNSLIIHKI